MRVTHLTAGALLLACLFLVPPAQAGDTLRLNLPDSTDAPLRNLLADYADLNADTDLVWHRGGFGGFRGGYYGGFRGGYGGFRGGYYGGFRGGYYGGYRGYAGFGYRGYYGGYYPRYYGYSGGYYGGYYPRYYGYSGGYYGGGYPSYYGYSCYPGYSYSYYGICATPYAISYSAPVMPRALSVTPSAPAAPPDTGTPSAPAPTVPVPPLPGNGTFQYDGGPTNPVPMPKGDDKPARTIPRGPAVVDIMVSHQEPTSGKWVYPAYGETARRQSTKGSASVQLIPVGRPAR